MSTYITDEVWIVLKWWLRFYPPKRETPKENTAGEESAESASLGLLKKIEGERTDPKRSSDKGDRAKLRRCFNLEDIVLDRSYQALRERWEDKFGREPEAERLAVLARVLIEVKKHSSAQSLGEKMAFPAPQSDSPRISEIRFRRLLDAETFQDLLNELLRVVALLGEDVNPLNLANFILGWYADERGDKARQSLANQYYLSLIRREENKHQSLQGESL